MQQKAMVRTANPDGTAQVVVIRESACSGDCHKCSGCGAAKETIVFEAVNTIGARPGELVTVTSESGPVLAGAAVLYIVPLVLFIAGYLLGEQISAGALIGAVGFVLGVVLAVIYDRKVASRRKTVYTITGYLKGTHTERDHHID